MAARNVSVYLGALGELRHVQENTGRAFPRRLREYDAAGDEVPLVRLDCRIDEEPGETREVPLARVFLRELEVDRGVVRYRASSARTGRIRRGRG